ncbi:MAG TPA: ABC transporter substrate-binding protein [Burkholderiaceae bacterium]|nr:ABC transporter substrate-binding protein [Burkholderiaceae bacterium]
MRPCISRRRLLLAAGASGALAAMGSPAAFAQARGKPIVIGHSGPLSGPLANTNREALNVAARVFDQVNAQGGIYGRPIAFELLDDAQNPQWAADNTRTLIQRHQAVALFGYRTSPAVTAALPIATGARVPFVAPQVGPAALYEPVNPYAFCIRASYHDEVVASLNLLFSVGFRKVAFLYANDAFGRDVQRAVNHQLKQLGGEPAAEIWIENTHHDAGQTIQALWSAQPLAILLATNNRIAADVIKKYRALSQNSAQFVTLSNNSSASFVNELEGSGRGVVVTQVLPFPYTSMTPASRQLRRMLAETASPPSYAAMHGYLGAQLIVEGLRRSGGYLTAAGLYQGLDNATIDLGGFVVDYTEGKRHGSKLVDITTIGPDGAFYR